MPPSVPIVTGLWTIALPGLYSLRIAPPSEHSRVQTKFVWTDVRQGIIVRRVTIRGRVSSPFRRASTVSGKGERPSLIWQLNFATFLWPPVIGLTLNYTFCWQCKNCVSMFVEQRLQSILCYLSTLYSLSLIAIQHCYWSHDFLMCV